MVILVSSVCVIITSNRRELLCVQLEMWIHQGLAQGLKLTHGVDMASSGMTFGCQYHGGRSNSTFTVYWIAGLGDQAGDSITFLFPQICSSWGQRGSYYVWNRSTVHFITLKSGFRSMRDHTQYITWNVGQVTPTEMANDVTAPSLFSVVLFVL